MFSETFSHMPSQAIGNTRRANSQINPSKISCWTVYELGYWIFCNTKSRIAYNVKWNTSTMMMVWIFNHFVICLQCTRLMLCFIFFLHFRQNCCLCECDVPKWTDRETYLRRRWWQIETNHRIGHIRFGWNIFERSDIDHRNIITAKKISLAILKHYLYKLSYICLWTCMIYNK